MHHVMLTGMMDDEAIRDGLDELRPFLVFSLQESALNISSMSVPDRPEHRIYDLTGLTPMVLILVDVPTKFPILNNLRPELVSFVGPQFMKPSGE